MQAFLFSAAIIDYVSEKFLEVGEANGVQAAVVQAVVEQVGVSLLHILDEFGVGVVLIVIGVCHD
jgi:hypothetical protein